MNITVNINAHSLIKRYITYIRRVTYKLTCKPKPYFFKIHLSTLYLVDEQTIANDYFAVNTKIYTIINIIIFTSINCYVIIQSTSTNREMYMKMLPVKFSDTQTLKIKDLVSVVGIDNSKIARAAMRLGLIQIQALASRDLEKAKDLVLVNDARAK